jgi:G patch domain-containing protein 1
MVMINLGLILTIGCCGMQAIFSDDSDDDADEILNNQPVDPLKTSEGANMTLNRLVAEDFLESLGKELGLEVPPERPNVSSRPETLAVAGASGSPWNERITTALAEVKDSPSSFSMVQFGNANQDAPLASAEKLALKYEKQENRTEENRSRHMHRQNQSHSLRSDSSSERNGNSKRRSYHHIRDGTPESDSSSERHRKRRSKFHSRHKKGRSRTPETDSRSNTEHDRKFKEKRHRRTYTSDSNSSDHERKDRYKSSRRRSSDKDTSRKHSRHHKHRRKDHVYYS